MPRHLLLLPLSCQHRRQHHHRRHRRHHPVRATLPMPGKPRRESDSRTLGTRRRCSPTRTPPQRSTQPPGVGLCSDDKDVFTCRQNRRRPCRGSRTQLKLGADQPCQGRTGTPCRRPGEQHSCCSCCSCYFAAQDCRSRRTCSASISIGDRDWSIRGRHAQEESRVWISSLFAFKPRCHRTDQIRQQCAKSARRIGSGN